jgi:hypothetical protein
MKNFEQKTKLLARPLERKVRVRFSGSMPAPQKEHGDEMLGGVILGREWRINEWEYRVQHQNGNVSYHRAP